MKNTKEKFTISQKIQYSCEGVSDVEIQKAKILANHSPKLLEALKDLLDSSKKHDQSRTADTLGVLYVSHLNAEELIKKLT